MIWPTAVFVKSFRIMCVKVVIYSVEFASEFRCQISFEFYLAKLLMRCRITRSDRVPTVDDQPYCIEDLVMEIQNYIKYMWVLNSKTHRILLYLTCLETLSFHVSCKYPYYWISNSCFLFVLNSNIVFSVHNTPRYHN